MYRAAPRRKALTVALVKPNKPNSHCAFVAVTYTENSQGQSLLASIPVPLGSYSQSPK